MRANVQGRGFIDGLTLPLKPPFARKPYIGPQGPIPPNIGERRERGGLGPGPRADSPPAEGRKEERERERGRERERDRERERARGQGGLPLVPSPGERKKETATQDT